MILTVFLGGQVAAVQPVWSHCFYPPLVEGIYVFASEAAPANQLAGVPGSSVDA